MPAALIVLMFLSLLGVPLQLSKGHFHLNMKTKKKYKKPKIFTQGMGTYADQLLVICGASKKEVFSFLKKGKASVKFSEWVLNDFSHWEESIKNRVKGLFCFNDEIQGAVLFIGPVDDDWGYWQILMHEIHHVVFKISHQKAFVDEIEAQAYLFEFLFKEIRRKMMGLEPI